MKLSEQGLQEKAVWEAAGYSLPAYDRAKMMEATKDAPTWIHFGAGNIFRAFQANVVQKLLAEKVLDKGLIVAEGFDYEIIEKMYRPCDDLSILVTLKADGNVEKTVVGSIAESCILDSENDREFGRLKEIFSAASLQMASFTITEKGYSTVDGKGQILPGVAEDLKKGPGKPVSYLGKVVSLLYTRFRNGALPIAMVSMDNCSHNGDKLYAAVKTFADAWVEAGLVEKEFLAYACTPKGGKVSYPWSMIDKITPRPDASVLEILRKDGLEDLDPVVTSKNTYVAPFVNAEECEYLVIEDDFPNGRPALEKGGLIFTDRETVNRVERMKVCTCLNPLHTALAVYGCLLGYTSISAEMKDPELLALVNRIGYVEGLPVVTDPGVLNPKEFIDTVLQVRVPNPFMPDTPQRIATDTSQKLAIRFGETVKNYLANQLDMNTLKGIPFVFAGWLRYLMAVDDAGKTFTLSPDPLLETACPYVASFQLGDDVSAEAVLETVKPLLTNEKIFGVDLVEIGMAFEVCVIFVKLLAGPGAIRKALQEAEF